jgi:hypothetical protein
MTSTGALGSDHSGRRGRSVTLTQNGTQVSMPQILAAAGATQGTAGVITKGYGDRHCHRLNTRA